MTAGYRIPARIETARLVVRRYTEADAEALSEVTSRNRDHLIRYMEWARLEPQTPAQRREFIETVNAEWDAGRDYTMGIFERATGAFLGGTGFHVRHEPDRLEIGYWVDAAREGEGIATEVAAALTQVALSFADAPLVAIAHAPSNVRSAAIPARLGYARQEKPAGYACHDGGETVTPVDWHATVSTLSASPLASVPRPALFDEDGAALAWPE